MIFYALTCRKQTQKWCEVVWKKVGVISYYSFGNKMKTYIDMETMTLWMSIVVMYEGRQNSLSGMATII